MLRDGEIDEETGAVAVAGGAEAGVHMAGKFGRDIEAKAGAARAHGDVDWGADGPLAKFAPDAGGESGAKIAHTDADAVVRVGDGEHTDGVVVGIANGVGAEVIDDAVEEVAIGDGEPRAVTIRDREATVFVAEERVEFARDLVTDAADAERLGRKEAIFETGNFRKVIDLAHGALGDGDELGLDARAGGLVIGEVERERKLAKEGKRRFQIVRSNQNAVDFLHFHEFIIA